MRLASRVYNTRYCTNIKMISPCTTCDVQFNLYQIFSLVTVFRTTRDIVNTKKNKLFIS